MDVDQPLGGDLGVDPRRVGRFVAEEDGAALVGVALAALGLVGGALVGDSTPDALASLLIGLLLGATAFGLARPLADFLVGRSMPVEELQRLLAILAAAPVTRSFAIGSTRTAFLLRAGLIVRPVGGSGVTSAKV